MAENTQTQTQTQTQTTQETNQVPAGGIDYGKIEAMINKGTQQKESAILNSYFKQQGLSDDEMKQAISDFKANRKNAAKEHETEFSALKTENEKLKAQIQQSKVQTAAQQTAFELGVDVKNVPFVLKLADFEKVIDEKGEINSEALKTALSKVLEDVPAFKQTIKDSKGFVTVGGKEQSAQDNKAEDEKLRKAFGL